MFAALSIPDMLFKGFQPSFQLRNRTIGTFIGTSPTGIQNDLIPWIWIFVFTLNVHIVFWGNIFNLSTQSLVDSDSTIPFFEPFRIQRWKYPTYSNLGIREKP